MEPDEVLVLGATGLVGSHVVSELVASGRSVVAVARSPQADRSGVRWIRADMTKPDDVDQIPGCSSAVSTLAIWLMAEVSPTLVGRGLQRVVAFSSSSATTKADASDVTERQLAARLQAAEERLLALSPALQSTILRPTMIYGGPGDANVERIAGQVRRFRAFPVVSGGDGLRQPVHAQDLGVAAVRALLTPGTEGQVYAVAGGEVLTVREMVRRVAAANGVGVRFLPVPRRASESALRLMARLPKFRKVPPGALERLARDLVFDNGPAIADFGYAPRGFDPPDYRRS